MTDFNLHTIVRLPNGVFAPYTPIPANILFFDRTGPTKDIWFYEQPLPEGKKNYTKTAPVQWSEFAPCLAWWKNRKPNAFAWNVSIEQVKADGFNLDLMNPTRPKGAEELTPLELVTSLLEKEERVVQLLKEIKSMVAVQ